LSQRWLVQHNDLVLLCRDANVVAGVLANANAGVMADATVASGAGVDADVVSTFFGGGL
jgi:hypothetical protein